MKSKDLALLSILAVVIVSGCAGTTSNSGVEFSQTAGLVINDFSLDTNELFEGDDTAMTIQVQNVGAKTMDADSKLWIYGPSVSGSTNVQIWKILSGGDIKLTKSVLEKTLPTKTTFTPPDVARKIPGSIDISTLKLQAPDLGLAPSMSYPYTFYARACYPYSTTTFSTVTEISKNELKISNPPMSDAITRATAGPIQMKLLSGDTLLANRQLVLVFEISNVGGGFSTLPSVACKSDIEQTNTDRLKISATVDGTNAPCTLGDDFSIRKSNKIVCKLGANAIENPTKSHTIIGTATYHYYVTREADITVNSKL